MRQLLAAPAQQLGSFGFLDLWGLEVPLLLWGLPILGVSRQNP